MIVTAVIGILILSFNKQKQTLENPLTINPLTNIQKTIVTKNVPSETLIDYKDPSGFGFSYPDNLSITKNTQADPNAYADLQLSSKDISGSLSLKIIDSKLTTLQQWAKLNTGTSKDIKLGTLKALEIQTADRLLLGALDQGILFTIEIPLIEQEFWTKVYSKLLVTFSFVTPEATNQQAGPSSTSNDIIFEGEEVIE